MIHRSEKNFMLGGIIGGITEELDISEYSPLIRLFLCALIIYIPVSYLLPIFLVFLYFISWIILPINKNSNG